MRMVNMNNVDHNPIAQRCLDVIEHEILPMTEQALQKAIKFLVLLFYVKATYDSDCRDQ